MATITPQNPSIDGVAPTANAASVAGDVVLNANNNVMLRFINAAGASRTITLAVASDVATRPAGSGYPQTVYANKAITVPAGTTRVVGPVTRLYTSSAGNVTMTYDSSTSLTIEAWYPEASA
jgi:hypothetical protein